MKRMIARWVARLPANSMSRAVGVVTEIDHPRLAVRAASWAFARAAGIDLAEAEIPAGGFTSMDALFTRRLRHGARRIDPEANSVVSPVDGTTGESGVIDGHTAIQAKGVPYRVDRLLDSTLDGKRFAGGAFATYYLSPRDYHRIHAPVAGTVERCVVIPGGLLPVFPESCEMHPDLFIRNERVVTYLRHKTAGQVAVVKIGATAVGKITVSYDDTIRSNAADGQRLEVAYDNGYAVTKGGEIGTFHLGSTVVLLFEPGAVILGPVECGRPVRMGAPVGVLARDP